MYYAVDYLCCIRVKYLCCGLTYFYFLLVAILLDNFKKKIEVLGKWEFEIQRVLMKINFIFQNF